MELIKANKGNRQTQIRDISSSAHLVPERVIMAEHYTSTIRIPLKNDESIHLRKYRDGQNDAAPIPFYERC